MGRRARRRKAALFTSGDIARGSFNIRSVTPDEDATAVTVERIF